jgi:membrane associated rhomboid family serine protease
VIPIHDVIPPARRPWVTLALIAMTVAAFAWQLTRPADAQLSPSVLTWWLHTGWLHAASNVGLLWLFGENVEDRMGHARFLAFYLVAAALAQGAAAWMTGMADTASGASGAVAGVGAAYLLLFPKSRVHVLIVLPFWIDLVEIVAIAFFSAWVMLQLALGGPPMLWTILGGFAAGAALHRLLLGAPSYWIRTSSPAAARPATPARDR